MGKFKYENLDRIKGITTKIDIDCGDELLVKIIKSLSEVIGRDLDGYIK